MKNIIRITILALTLFSFKAQASASRQLVTSCDTLITTNGETLLVSIEQRTDAFIQYRNCGVPEGDIIELPISFVKEIRKAHFPLDVPEDAQKVDALTEKNDLEIHTALVVFSSLGVLIFTFLAFLVTLEYLFGVLLVALAGFFIARWVKRHTRHKVQYTRLNKIATIANLLNILTLIGTFLVFLRSQFSYD